MLARKFIGFAINTENQQATVIRTDSKTSNICYNTDMTHPHLNDDYKMTSVQL